MNSDSDDDLVWNYINRRTGCAEETDSDEESVIRCRRRRRVIVESDSDSDDELVIAPLSPEDELVTINARIEAEFCPDTYRMLTDEALCPLYLETKSVKKRIKKLENNLDQYDISAQIKAHIVRGEVPDLVPAGTKGAIRGKKFNDIVREFVEGLDLDPERFSVSFEKKSRLTSETPDWRIVEKSTDRTLIGMNQVDMWNGGAQIMRGYYYLVENNRCNTDNSKLLCVVCNKKRIGSPTAKEFKMFKIGFENNTLCYMKNLKNIIHQYFSL